MDFSGHTQFRHVDSLGVVWEELQWVRRCVWYGLEVLWMKAEPSWTRAELTGLLCTLWQSSLSITHILLHRISLEIHFRLLRCFIWSYLASVHHNSVTAYNVIRVDGIQELLALLLIVKIITLQCNHAVLKLKPEHCKHYCIIHNNFVQRNTWNMSCLIYLKNLQQRPFSDEKQKLRITSQ